MCNVRDTRDAWFMLTSLREIRPKLLEQFEEDAEREVDTSMQMMNLSELQRRKYTDL